MEKLAHWTQRSTADFVYSISSSFVAQLETRMEDMPMNKTELAERLGKTNGRVSQVFNDPGNLSLRIIVEYARALGMKVGIVAYDDSDPRNNNGPINPDVFVKSWEKVGRPNDLFEVAEVGVKQWQIALDPDRSHDPYGIQIVDSKTLSYCDLISREKSSPEHYVTQTLTDLERTLPAFRSLATRGMRNPGVLLYAQQNQAIAKELAL